MKPAIPLVTTLPGLCLPSAMVTMAGWYTLAMDSRPVAQRISDQKYRQGREIERTNKEYALDLLRNAAPMRVLDVGCGTGRSSSELSSAGHEVVGVDISPIAIDQYRAQGFEGYVCDILKGLPLENESFDAIFTSEVIEHIDDTERFLGEIGRILKPGGQMVLSTPNSSFWVYRLLGLVGRTVSELQHPGHVRFFSKRSLESALTQAGFEVLDISGRNIYLLLATEESSKLSRPLKAVGLKSERRFGTETRLWHASHWRSRASPFWSDTLILRARKGDMSIRPIQVSESPTGPAASEWARKSADEQADLGPPAPRPSLIASTLRSSRGIAGWPTAAHLSDSVSVRRQRAPESPSSLFLPALSERRSPR